MGQFGAHRQVPRLQTINGGKAWRPATEIQNACAADKGCPQSVPKTATAQALQVHILLAIRKATISEFLLQA